MDKKILVTYATKYGSTAAIAEKIGQVLRQAGLSVDVLATSRVTDLAPYGAVILGSAVYVGQWLKEAVTFLESHEQQLTELPTWLFSSGPTGYGDPMQLMKGWRFPAAQQSIADRIKPRAITLFHGMIDLKHLNLVERLMMRAVKAPVGDFRDWPAITAWASGVADMLKREVPQPVAVS